MNDSDKLIMITSPICTVYTVVTPVTQFFKKGIDVTISNPRYLDLNGFYYLLKHEDFFILLMNLI